MEWDPPGIWRPMEAFLRGLAATLPFTPRAILMVSAHWQAQDFAVTTGASPPLIFDYYGFPPHTYELRYPDPGEPVLAQRVQGLLTQAGLSSHGDAARGFDHGMFIPLLLMFPEARIPVVQLSLRDDPCIRLAQHFFTITGLPGAVMTAPRDDTWRIFSPPLMPLPHGPDLR